jgi:hypothetical protein
MRMAMAVLGGRESGGGMVCECIRTFELVKSSVAPRPHVPNAAAVALAK